MFVTAAQIFLEQREALMKVYCHLVLVDPLQLGRSLFCDWWVPRTSCVIEIIVSFVGGPQSKLEDAFIL